MTQEQKWQCAAIHARGIVLDNPDAMVANGVIWADDRIKALEKENLALVTELETSKAIIRGLEGMYES